MQERIKAILQREPSEEIVKAEKIEATEEDINAEYEKLAKAYGMEVDAVKSAVPAENLAGDIKSQKAIGIIKENAVEGAAKKTAAKTEPATKKDDAEKPAKKPAAKKTTAKKDDAVKPAKKPAAKKTTKKTEE